MSSAIEQQTQATPGPAPGPSARAGGPASAGASQARQVRRRRVIYIPGYDPFHPRRYRELYRKEAAAQAQVSGYEIALSPRPTDKSTDKSTSKSTGKSTGKSTANPYGWHVTAEIDGAAVSADVEVLVWSDIVKHSMGQSILATYGAMLRTAWVYISTGALFRLMRLRKGPVIAALYPVVMLIAQFALALAAGYGTGLGARHAVSWAAGALAIGADAALPGAVAGIVAGLLTGLGTVWLVLSWFKRRDSRFFVYYLMHDYSYSACHRGANPPELEARMAAFADTIAEALRDAVDEVLVVGHSSGAHLGVSVLADLVRQGRVPANGPALSFLSLGQVVPMVSFLPEARRLRRDLHDLSQSPHITWVDVTAPGDGCAFALCDPVAVSGVAPAAGKRWPLVFSAAFTKSLTPARWKALRWRFFRLHFQYLCAFDAPRDYDYFRITAGPRTLGARYAARVASKSRIETPVNGFTDMA